MDRNEIAVGIFDRLAALYEEKFMDVSMYHDTLDRFCAEVKPGAKILELACGPGNITQYLLDKRPDLEILATDMSPNMIALCGKNNPTAKCEVRDCRSFSEIETKFDAIMCGFALPYLSEAETAKLIADSAKALNEGGVIYLSTMDETQENKSGFRMGSGGEIYMYYHNAEILQQNLKSAGFGIISLSRKVYPENDGMTSDLIIIARKG